MKKYRWAVKVYRKAAIIISEITGTRMNFEAFLNNIVQECERVIEKAQLESGIELDIDELSEEEDADFVQDHRLEMNVLLVSNPVIAMGQQMLTLQLIQKKKQLAACKD